MKPFGFLEEIFLGMVGKDSCFIAVPSTVFLLLGYGVGPLGQVRYSMVSLSAEGL